MFMKPSKYPAEDNYVRLVREEIANVLFSDSNSKKLESLEKILHCLDLIQEDINCLKADLLERGEERDPVFGFKIANEP